LSYSHRCSSIIAISSRSRSPADEARTQDPRSTAHVASRRGSAQGRLSPRW